MIFRTGRAAILALFVSTAGFGYYHFVHYAAGGAPYTAIPEKFDLSSLPDRTVTYHIAESGPSSYAATDSFPLVVGQIRAAAKVWDEVETSELRIRFGGIASRGANDNAATPSIEVVFEDLPPGVNGYGGPTVRNEVITGAGGAMVPIQRSVVVLNKNLTERPSWSEQFFGTAVHEFGHALGLQHSFTSGAMATEITRATTKMRPILPDDAVGLSLLYPTRSFRDGLGSISGRVAAGPNDPMGLASVVAVSPGGAAIGTLTHPDGTYRIDGLPPGQYYLYAHALPPATSAEATPGNVLLPVDPLNRPIPGGQQFDTLFYPASRTPFITVAVAANATSDNMNFTVNRRTSPVSIGAVETYSFPGQRAVRPAHLYTAGARNFVVMTGNGLMQNGQPAPGLQVSSFSGVLSLTANGLRAYTPQYLQAEFQFGLLANEGPVHLVFSRGNDIYVLPYGLRIADRVPPQIESISGRNDSGDVVVSGPGLQASTRIAFDSVYATTKAFDEATGRLTVTPPSAPAGSQAHVVAFGTDGQSSLFMQPAASWTYDQSLSSSTVPESVVGLSSTNFSAGTESAIEISGTGFVEGQTSLGFGTPDIVVRNMWFPSPNRLVANLWVAPGASGGYHVTMLNGLRLIAPAAAVQVNPSRALWISVPSGSLVTGTQASIQVNGASFSSASSLQLMVGDRTIPITSVDGPLIHFTVPANLPAGVSLVRVQAGGEPALPLAVNVTQPPAIVSSVTAGLGTLITPERPARYGELNTMLITGLPESLLPSGTPRLTMSIGGIEHRPLTVSAVGGSVQVQFIIQQLVQPGLQPLNVTVEGITVQTYMLPVRPF